MLAVGESLDPCAGWQSFPCLPLAQAGVSLGGRRSRNRLGVQGQGLRVLQGKEQGRGGLGCSGSGGVGGLGQKLR